MREARRTTAAVARSLIFILKALPATSHAIDLVTAPPIVGKLRYPTQIGDTEADLYRPSSPGPHPGVVVCLGVVPAGVEHPQVRRFGEALARAGFAALLNWSPAMRDLRLDPADIDALTAAYQTLLEQPYVDPTRSGFIGTCVGGSFALMAAAQPSIRDRIAFVSAYAAYSSMWTLARDIASATRTIDSRREHWQVDPLAWKTFVRSITELLAPDEANRLRDAFQERYTWNETKTVILEAPVAARPDPTELSEEGRAVLRLLTTDPDKVDAALRLLPTEVQALLTSMSPMTYVDGIHAPLIALLHDRRDHLIPVSESRQLWAALAGRESATYTELGFRHLDPTKLSPIRLARELPRLYSAIYPLYRRTTA